MQEDMLAALALPLLFSMTAGTYGFVRFPERRANILLVTILFQLLGAFAVNMQPSTALLGLLCVHALVVSVLLVQHVQTPQPVPVEQQR